MKVMPAECVRHPSLRLPGISLKQKFDMQQVEFLESSRFLLLSFLKCLEESKHCKLFLLQSWTLCFASGIYLSTFPKTLTSKKHGVSRRPTLQGRMPWTESLICYKSSHLLNHFHNPSGISLCSTNMLIFLRSN